MTDLLSDNDLAAMIARDDAAGDGLSTRDDQVYIDRHRLIQEVQRLRALPVPGGDGLTSTERQMLRRYPDLVTLPTSAWPDTVEHLDAAAAAQREGVECPVCARSPHLRRRHW